MNLSDLFFIQLSWLFCVVYSMTTHTDTTGGMQQGTYQGSTKNSQSMLNNNTFVRSFIVKYLQLVLSSECYLDRFIFQQMPVDTKWCYICLRKWPDSNGERCKRVDKENNANELEVCVWIEIDMKTIDYHFHFHIGFVLIKLRKFEI